jgi:hypothetical protein
MTKSYLFAKLDGYVCVSDGLHGTLKLTDGRLLHVPSTFGRATAKYKALKTYVGHDWGMDLTDEDAECARLLAEMEERESRTVRHDLLPLGSVR